jgi:fructose-specific phosphotransferase system IIC component
MLPLVVAGGLCIALVCFWHSGFQSQARWQRL